MPHEQMFRGGTSSGIILPGVTRHSLIELARSWGEFKVSERDFTMQDVTKALKERRLRELFGAGTACVVSPVEKIISQGQDLHTPTMDNGAPVTMRLYSELTDIQTSSFLRASYEGNLDQVLDLLEDGVPVNCCNQAGLQATHFAAKAGSVEIIQHLITHGANINAVSAKGNTPLHVAALLGQTDVIKLLLRNDANVNLLSDCNEDHFSPLYMAAQIGHQEIVMLLLAHGADPTLPTKNGSLARDVAHQEGYHAVAELLDEYERRTAGGNRAHHNHSPDGAVGGDPSNESHTVTCHGKTRPKSGPPPIYSDTIHSPKQSPVKTLSTST